MNQTPQNEAFMQVLANRTMLKLFILSIVHDIHLAEDTLSDVTVAIAQSWAQYDQKKPFGPWARGVAKRVALTNLRKKKRPVVTLDDDILEAFGNALSKIGSEGDLDEIRLKLKRCVNKLSDSKRKLITLRYFDDKSYAEISKLTNHTPAALYMAYSRIHRMLAQCVKGLL